MLAFITRAPRHASPTERTRRAQEAVDRRPDRPMVPDDCHGPFRGFVSGANAGNVQMRSVAMTSMGSRGNALVRNGINGAQVPLPRPDDDDEEL